MQYLQDFSMQGYIPPTVHAVMLSCNSLVCRSSSVISTNESFATCEDLLKVFSDYLTRKSSKVILAMKKVGILQFHRIEGHATKNWAQYGYKDENLVIMLMFLRVFRMLRISLLGRKLENQFHSEPQNESVKWHSQRRHSNSRCALWNGWIPFEDVCGPYLKCPRGSPLVRNMVLERTSNLTWAVIRTRPNW
jgi:hypothetical protein